MMPTTDQVKGIADRLIAILLVWLVAKGHIGKEDALEYGPLVIGLLSALYAGWINRPKALIQSAAALPSTTIVTTPEIANNTPEKNIVSTVTNTVVDTLTGVENQGAKI